MNNLDRAVIHALLEAGASIRDRIYHVGYNTRIRSWISDRMPNLVSSRFQAGRQPGQIENGVRIEDLTALSFGDGEFDYIICMEILEHIPDYRAALREMARTLKSGGRALLSFPWLGGGSTTRISSGPKCCRMVRSII